MLPNIDETISAFTTLHEPGCNTCHKPFQMQFMVNVFISTIGTHPSRLLNNITINTSHRLPPSTLLRHQATHSTKSNTIKTPDITTPSRLKQYTKHHINTTLTTQKIIWLQHNPHCCKIRQYTPQEQHYTLKKEGY